MPVVDVDSVMDCARFSEGWISAFSWALGHDEPWSSDYEVVVIGDEDDVHRAVSVDDHFPELR